MEAKEEELMVLRLQNLQREMGLGRGFSHTEQTKYEKSLVVSTAMMVSDCGLSSSMLLVLASALLTVEDNYFELFETKTFGNCF